MMDAAGPPREFEGYRLIRQVGAGGMGRVFLGHDTLLDRPVAVKFISAQDPGAEARSRFLLEARAVARLQHPCVVTVFRAGEFEGQPYIVSEFVEGESLDRMPLPVPWEQVLRIAYDLSRGLTVAHRAGVVHRDIKPGNAILATDGTAKLLDFGIARLMDAPAAEGEPGEAEPDGAAAPLGTVRLAATPRPGLDEDGPATVAVDLPDRLEEEDPPTVRVDLPNRLEAGPATPADAFPGRITLPGRAVGTPAYMAPEVWRGEKASFASDVYSLGALLFSLCAGRPPHEATSIGDLRTLATEHDAPPLASVVSEVSGAFAEVVNRCLQRDPQRRYQDGNEVRAALVPLVAPSPTAPIPEGNPYRGLRAFDVDQQAFFFGRDSEIRAILERVSSDPVVVVTGDSGVGKSSVCRAGVLSRVKDWLADGFSWEVATVVPGRHPVQAICRALGNAAGVPGESLAEALADGLPAFGRALRQALGPRRGLVLFVDQLEELVTQSEPAEGSLAATLFGWIRDPVPGFRILATVRGDFLGRLASVRGIGDALSSVLYFLRPLSPERLREAVVGPARLTGIAFESEALVDTLVEGAAGAGGALPLLQFALQELWERRDVATRRITAAALEALGGVVGALSLHADQVLAGLPPERRQRARRILLRLVTPEGTRARPTPEELAAEDPDGQATLNALVEGRLVVARKGPEGASYEVAHEALITGWGTLVRWLSSNLEGRVVRGRITAAAAEWERLGRTSAGLWSDRQLQETALVDEEELSPVERAFVAASARQHRRRRLVRWLVVAGAVLAVAGTYGGMRMKAAMETAALVNERIAKGQQLLEDAARAGEELSRSRTEAWQLFDDRKGEAAEARWDEARKAEARYRENLGQAARELEAAVALDPDREEARRLFAGTLFDRAVEAEERGALAERDDFLLRMSLYDDGTQQARWDAPGTLAVSAPVPGASVTLERYAADDKGKLHLESVSAPGELPFDGLSLPPGSYRLTVRAAGYEEVLYPVQLSRGEAVAVEVAPVPVGSVPEGFVYVPPGRFLFGSAQDDETRRGFHHTAPVHHRSTGAYLIARHETTFRQWLEYLEALPLDMREKRKPSVHAGGFEGALSVTELPGGGWRLSFKPTATAYAASSGEQIVYPGRSVRKAQDWLRFPVVGITSADAEAYAAWLDETGRLPGARLCTDLEWERAARGADGREYPHGNSLSPEEANFDNTYAKDPASMGPDEVGSHPRSRSPFGLDDMAGNVWEWTRSSLEEKGHAARGGSYYFDINTARTHNRETPEPSFRDASVGFRVCADVLSPAS